MPIQSVDQLIAAMADGKINRYDFNKITGGAAYTAGRWYEFLSLNGSPVGTAFPGTALTWQTCNETLGDGTNAFGMFHGGDVIADIKHALNLAAWTTALTGVPGTLMFVDVQGYYPGINMNLATAQTLLGVPTLRYANGAGLRAFLCARVTTGATAHNIAYNYDNQAGVAKANPFTVAATASAIVSHILHSGTAANNFGPFLPMASGDSGIRDFNTITLSAASGAGTSALVLCKPLTHITLGVASLTQDKDLLNQIPSLPRIVDGACIGILYGAGAATAASTTFAGALESVWG